MQQQDQQKTGTLYVVATPIGNLKDITLRALEVLKRVDRIVAEDTRHAGLLLNHYSIAKPMVSLHEFNERERLARILQDLERGEAMALVSDAGTPLISDPGFHLVRAVRAHGYHVVPIPGPCAAIAAVSVAGLPTDRFVFEGFLPAKLESCRQYLISLLQEQRTMVFYEAPHRLLATLQLMGEVFGGERAAVVARELTKIHESVLANPLHELIRHYESHTEQQRGEVVILVQGHEVISGDVVTITPEKVLDCLLAELPLKQAVVLASQLTGERKNVLYALALAKRHP